MHEVPVQDIAIAQILAFLKTVELRSFTRAAAQLYVTQSAVSKAVAGLEHTLGLQLLLRNGQTLQVTPAGNMLYETWSGLIRQLELSIQQAHEIQQGYARALRVGGLDSHRPDALAAQVVRRYHQDHPDVLIRLETCSSPPELKRRLVEGELDCIFTVFYDVEEGDGIPYAYRLVRQCPLEVCMLQSNPLSRAEHLTVGDLRASRFISLSPLELPSYTRMITELCRREGFVPNIACHVSCANALALNLLTEQDVFICDRYFRDYGAAPYCFRPLENASSGIALCWQKNNPRPQVLDFLETALHTPEDSPQE